MSLDDIVAADRAKSGGKAKKDKGGRAAPYDKPKKEQKKEPKKKESAPKKEPKEPKEAVPSKSVYVGNLAFTTEKAALEEHLSSAAPCTADVKTRKDGKPAGYAIVAFEDIEAATKAVETLNDAELDGRKLVVRFDNKP